MAHPRRHTKPRKRPPSRGDAGYTLVEVMVAMLLTSIMVTSLFSVALTVKTGGSKGESKIKAGAGARQVAAMLKNFVTAESGTVSTSAPDIPGPCAMGAAPNVINNWSISCNGVLDDCGGGPPNCYALAAGSHTVSGIMGSFENAPYNARVTYFVDAATVVNGRPVPVVTITTNWTEP